jgi:hypothetical protein
MRMRDERWRDGDGEMIYNDICSYECGVHVYLGKRE